MSRWTPCLVGGAAEGITLGHPIVDEYLELVRARERPRAVDWSRVGVACVLADSKATPGPPLPLDGVLVRSLCAVHRLHFAGYRAAIGTSVTAVIAGRERVARGAQAARDAAHWFPRS